MIRVISIVILFILATVISVFEGIFFDVMVFDYYPELYGVNFVFYGIALILLVYTIVWIVRLAKRRKQHAGTKLPRGKTKTPTSTPAATFRAAPKPKTKAPKRKK